MCFVQMTDLGTDGKVVRVHTPRDPFLGTVNNPRLAVLALGRCGPDTGNIGSSKCLGDRKRDDLDISLYLASLQ
jgi:hypothetical protein